MRAAKVSCLLWGVASAATLSEIRIRDPFILPDEPSKTYYMYASAHGPAGRGVGAYNSRDLKDWSELSLVFDASTMPQPPQMVWAPEVHPFGGKYYLFTTLTHGDGRQQKRGTYILVSGSPKGPFRPLRDRSHTPPDWMALDGTLYVEEGVPWMVFCHEWVQITNGTMELVRLRPDLSDTAGAPATLFRAGDAPWVRELKPARGLVTDGAFLHRTRSGKLVMIWSSFGDQGYAVGQAVSASGKIAGPWSQAPERLFTEDGGHAMIFRTFDGKLMLTLHQPNSGGKERARLFQVDDSGDLLRIRR